MPGERTRGRFVLVGRGAAKASETVEARDLYTSSYFAVKRQYAEAAVQWAGTADRRANSWGILSAEHAVLPPRLKIDPYDTTVDDLRGEPIAGEPVFELPSGEPAKTELDQWAMRVHSALGSWLCRPYAADQQESPCRELVVLAGSDYVDALRERDIFTGRPTAIRTGRETYRALPPKATVWFPFQERDFDGMFEQMAWLSEGSPSSHRQRLQPGGRSYRPSMAATNAKMPRGRQSTTGSISKGPSRPGLSHSRTSTNGSLPRRRPDSGTNETANFPVPED